MNTDIVEVIDNQSSVLDEIKSKAKDGKVKSTDLVQLDLPSNLMLNDLERSILIRFVAGERTKDIATTEGIPLSSIQTLLAKKEVKAFVQEMIQARNTALMMELPNLLSAIVQDKIDVIEENDGRLADVSKKDPVEIIKVLGDLLKAQQGGEGEEKSGFAKIYNLVVNKG